MRTPRPLAVLLAALAVLAPAGGALGALPAALAVADEAPATTINVLGITDLHGHIDHVTDARTGAVTEPGAEVLACEVDAARAANPNTVLVSNGDNVGGSAYISSVLNDQPTIDVLNAMGLEVTSAGNHEFDQGVADLSGRIIPALDAPVLSANVTGDPVLDAEGDGQGTFVKEVGGIKVGFVGVTTDELPSLTGSAGLKGLTIDKATETANARATELKSSGRADVVVVLAHEDAAIYGNQFNGDVDAVVAGHTHVPFAQVVTSTAGTPIAVVQPDHYGSLLGSISLTVARGADGRATVSAHSATNIDLTASTCQTASSALAGKVAPIVAKARTDSEAAGKQVVATLGSDFLRGTLSADGALQAPGANRGTESTASNLIADSFAWWVRSRTSATGDHFIGIMNPGGVRADYTAGELTRGQAYTVQPFGNELGYATYSGAQVKEVLAQQWQPGQSRPVLILGVSANVQVVVDQDVADALEAGGTDRTGLIRSVSVDGQPLADDASVVVASNSFLLAGGDNFTGLTAATLVNTGIIDLDATSDYLAQAPSLTADYAKRQIGLATATRDGATTVRLTGLLFTNASEQQADGAAVSVSATVPTAGGTAVAGTSTIDPTPVTSAVPETGRAEVSLSLPADALTQACASGEGTCATVTLSVLDAAGRALRTVDVEVPARPGGTGEPTPEPSPAPTQAPSGQPSAAPSGGPGSGAGPAPSASPTPGGPGAPSTGLRGLISDILGWLRGVIDWFGSLFSGLTSSAPAGPGGPGGGSAATAVVA